MPLTKIDTIFDPSSPEIREGWKFFKTTTVTKQILMKNGQSMSYDVLTKTITFTHQTYGISSTIPDHMLDNWMPAKQITSRGATFHKVDDALKHPSPRCGDADCKSIICNYASYKSETIKTGFCFFFTLEDAEDNGEYSGLLVKCKVRGLTYAGSNGSYHKPYFALARELFIPRDELMKALFIAHQESLRYFVQTYGELA